MAFLSHSLYPFMILLVYGAAAAAATALENEHVLALDSSNFSQAIAEHPFVVVEFYAPWCGHCQQLAPEYEKAAESLKAHDPPIILVKVNADEEQNKALAQQHDVQGFPTLKIIRNNGASIRDYNGPRDSEGIVSYLKKMAGPPSTEITSADQAAKWIEEKSVLIVGVFSSVDSEEFANFNTVADELRTEYDFVHTLDVAHLPANTTASLITAPGIRLLKKFDEGFADCKELSVDGISKFIKEESMPSVVVMNKDPLNSPFLVKAFGSDDTKVLFFLNWTALNSEELKSAYSQLARSHKGKGLQFVLIDVEESERAMEYFSMTADRLPVILIQDKKGDTYVEERVESSKLLSTWLQDYFNGALEKYVKSEPIPEENDEPVKVIVADSLEDMVLKSGKNVLLEFYAPWCGHCKQLAPTLDEVAKSFQSDPTVIIAKMDATANDIESDLFEVKGYPTLYFYSSGGNLLSYDGGRSKEEIIDFINTNKDSIATTKEKDEVSHHDEL